MNKPFTLATAALLAIIALVQLVRFISGWEVSVNGVSIPPWVSAVACVIAAGLAAMTWIEARR